MAAILQTTFFLEKIEKIVEFWLKFHCKLFCLIDNQSALAQIIAFHQPGDRV